VLWPETSSPSPSRPLLFYPFHLADSAFELNKAYVSTLLPSYCVCSHHRSISLPSSLAGTQHPNIPPFWLAASPFLACLTQPPPSPNKSTRVRTGHGGGQGQGYTTKTTLAARNVGNVLRAGRDERDPAKQRHASHNTSCSPRAAHHPSPAPPNESCALLLTPDIPLVLTVQRSPSVYPHAFASLCPALPCPVRCMRVIQLKGYSGLSRLCWRSVTPSCLPANRPTLSQCQKLNHIMSCLGRAKVQFYSWRGGAELSLSRLAAAVGYSKLGKPRRIPPRPLWGNLPPSFPSSTQPLDRPELEVAPGLRFRVLRCRDRKTGF
jgi:hypothetical protein